MHAKVNLDEKFRSFDEPWVPKIVGELNNQLVKVVKFEGEHCWHHHEHEDELFWVIRGSIRIHLRDGEVVLGEGEFFVVPRGIEHKPVAAEVAEVVLFEPATTLNTGNVRNELTQDDLERL